jgi:hypothetical protein
VFILQESANKSKRKRVVEQVFNPWNIMRAYRKVLSNNGSASVDGMPIVIDRMLQSRRADVGHQV